MIVKKIFTQDLQIAKSLIIVQYNYRVLFIKKEVESKI